jgi:3-hydroxybutyryl-CoA dehydrogenase
MIKIGVIGSGSMGTGIAQVAATAGHEVYLYDNNPSALDRSEAFIHKIMNRLVEKGRLQSGEAEAIKNRIHYQSNLFACSDASLIIEAIVENVDIKKQVFETLEDAVGEDAILATNTSSLSIAAIAAACKKPERVIGIHFFNPAALMKLVEIVPAVQTSEATQQKATEIIKGWGKTTVLAKDTPGFIVNRVARPFYGEALRILEEGLADVPTIDWAMTEIGGFKMGPFTLMDYIGNDINYTVTETVFEAFYYDQRYRPSFIQKRMVEAGFLGKKSGRGFYDYTEGAQKPEPKKDKEKGNEIFTRILYMLINEAADAAYLNIASAEDIDLAMTKGVNYPKGLLQWADEIGIQRCVNGMDRLYSEYLEARYRCSPLLRKLSRDGKGFFK